MGCGGVLTQAQTQLPTMGPITFDWALCSQDGTYIMQKTALSFTERSGHCEATGSDHWNWHPLATSEGDNVISYTVWREQELRSNSSSVGVTPLMSFCWCHSFNVHCECHFVDVTLSKLNSWFHFIDIYLKISTGWCHFVDVSLLMSLCSYQSVDVTLLTIRYMNKKLL